MKAWIWLAIAILFEVAGTTSLKASYGFSKLIPSLLTFVFYTISFITLAMTLKKVDIGVAYAIWSGVGTALIACLGFIYFGEAMSFWKILSIGLIVLGVIGLNLAGNLH